VRCQISENCSGVSSYSLCGKSLGFYTFRDAMYVIHLFYTGINLCFFLSNK
jgi:hypothetical protein